MTYSSDRGSLVSLEDIEILFAAAAHAPPGAFVEVGVYRGGTAQVLYALAEEQGRELWLFDTFAGHPDTDGDPDHYVGKYADCADPVALQGELPNAHIIVGRFPETLPQLPPVAFVHADADLYAVTRDICTLLPPMMVSGGRLYFDDYSHATTAGVRRAVDEIFPGRRVLTNGKAMVQLP